MEEDECPICMETIELNNKIVLDCYHELCKYCFFRVIKCPLCRAIPEKYYNMEIEYNIIHIEYGEPEIMVEEGSFGSDYLTDDYIQNYRLMRIYILHICMKTLCIAIQFIGVLYMCFYISTMILFVTEQ